MEALVQGQIINGTYRVDGVITRGPRADVYAVTHTRFSEVPLVLKVSDPDCRADFEADTAALGILTSPCVAHMVDRGSLPDGRPYRVVMKLKGPTLVEALANLTFLDARITDLCLSLSALAIEAHKNGIGPLDLTLSNLMFADGPQSDLCLIRVIKAYSTAPDNAADEAALVELRRSFERGSESVVKSGWKPPASNAEMRVAAHTPPISEPGAKIGTWRVVKTISDGLAATVHQVTDANGVNAVLKIAGPIADRETFIANGALMKKLVNPLVVRVLETGEHEGAPFYVMDPIEGQSYTEVLTSFGPLSVQDALWTVSQMLHAAEAIADRGGGPTDFSLQHCYRLGPESRQIVLTRPITTKTAVKRFGFYARALPEDASMDAWSAAIAIYELISGRLPFPISKHSLAKLWMGVPVPLNQRRKGISDELSQIVNELISGAMTISRGALIEMLLDFRLREMPAAPVPTKASAIEGKPIVPTPVKTIAEPVPVPPPVPGAPHAKWKFALQYANCPISNARQPTLTAATFSADGNFLIAFGADAVARHDGRHWKTPYLTPELRQMRGVRQAIPFGPNRYLLLGGDGRLYFLDDQGRVQLWPGQPAEFSLYGMAPYGDKGDRAYLVGASNPQNRGMLAKVVDRKLSLIAHELETAALHAVAPLPDGSVLATGQRGSVVRLRGGAVVEVTQACAADLHAVVPIKDGAKDEAVVLGNGAWALRVTMAPLSCVIERVETTANFTVATADENGNAWAGTDRGLVLRRSDQLWQRFETGSLARVLGMHATRNRTRALLADGLFVELVPNV